MNPELQAYLDAWESRRQREFEDLMACFDPLLRPASSVTTEFVLASAGLAEPPAPALPIASVTTVALLHEGVPELAVEPAALHYSPSTTNIGKDLDAAATVIEHKDAHEFAIPLTVNPSTWYDHLSCAFLDASHCPEYLVNGVHMHKQHGQLLLLPGHDPVCGYLSCDLQKPMGAILTHPFGSVCHVTSILMQKIVRSPELNLILSSPAPSFPMADHSDGGTVATYLNSDAVWTSFLCMITQRTSARFSYLMRLMTNFSEGDFGKLADIYRGITTCSLRFGRLILLWKDLWRTDLLQHSHAHLFSYALHEDVSVQEFVAQPDSSIHLQLPLSIEAYEELMQVQALVNDAALTDQDTDRWNFSWGSDVYKPTKFYRLIFQDDQPPSYPLLIWRTRCMMKHKVFAWLMLIDRINTRDMSTRRHFNIGNIFSCLTCSSGAMETRNHLIFTCTFGEVCWTTLGTQWLQNLVQLNYHAQDIGLESLFKLGVKILQQACALGLPDETNHSYFLCWDPGGLILVVPYPVDRTGNVDHKHFLGFDCDCANKGCFFVASFIKVSINHNNYFDTVCSDIISYREDYDDDSNKIKEVHMPWDPGKSSFKHNTPKLRLGDKPNFKEGGMLGPSPCASYWASAVGSQWETWPSPKLAAHRHLQIPKRSNGRGYPCEDQNRRRRRPFFPSGSRPLSPVLAVFF